MSKQFKFKKPDEKPQVPTPILLDSDSDEPREFKKRRVESPEINYSTSFLKEMDKEVETNPKMQIMKKQRELGGIQVQLDKLHAQAATLRAEISSLESYISEQEGLLLHLKPFNEPEWSTTLFPWSRDIQRLAKERFNITAFRHRQVEVINATLSGKDVFYIAPTGGGKSLTFQLPAILAQTTGFAVKGKTHLPQFTLVISPLLSLSKDQIIELEQVNVKARMLCGETGKQEAKDIFQETLAGSETPIMVLFVTPEKIKKSKSFLSHLEKCYRANRIARIVVDEAHCASQFGHDFRPDYLQLGSLRTIMPGLPMLCLSATCPPSLLNSCMNILGLRSADVVGKEHGTLVISTDLRRSNLHYEVLSLASQTKHEQVVKMVVKWIRKQAVRFHQAGIHKSPDSIPQGLVYCLTKADCESFAQALRQEGIKAGFYHSEVDGDDKEKVHKLWRQDKLQVICATPAFGLGISLPHVRFVVHTAPPPTLDRYYQESGRVGRDLKPASCLLVYRRSEWSRVWNLCSDDFKRAKTGISLVRRYCEETKECRVCLMERSFGNGSVVAGREPCKNCDVCQGLVASEWDVSSIAVATLENLVAFYDHHSQFKVKKSGDRLTFLKLMDFGGGRGLAKHRSTIQELRDPPKSVGGKKVTRLVLETMLMELIRLGYVQEEFSVNGYTTNVYLAPTESGRRFCRMYAMTPESLIVRIVDSNAIEEDIEEIDD
jgi:ATP-dependent DNA helicase Q1